ncbi:MAG: SDR family NAD(P)-dependent oxidoreductase [Acidobacteria bacterium]|nr:MAG: SDR family NAD(P)-dependent oxidoreductase [Acidobacteriota bacterium]REK02200.1 MAG: SDR family NAD(P)-dependent oxidoreductase [Acidobacteriota bacterium]REK13997.1 MAG: SDR family NAD(P)-dependent oxidoreductase [Acidobacteriota bacterium]REK41992.1 MAG: SDR family NAD(P)-dependent oxidoreductase [Acidobacteriota bacterium]
MSLTDRSVVVITGAGSGIGQALASRIAEEKVKGVAVSDLNEEGLADTVAAVEASGVDCISFKADVAKLEDIEALRDAVTGRFGSATHIVNNAGVGLVGRTNEVSFDDMRWLMDINFWGTVYGTKVFLPLFEQQGHGHIVNISSVFGLMAPPGQSTYCASKFAVRGFTESLRHELEGTDICVSCVHPGGVRTNIARAARKGENAPQEDKEIAPVIFEKVARTTPAEAAETILKGIKTKNPRILIGSDAVQMSMILRLFPKGYFKIMDRMSGGMLSKFK